MTTLNICLMPLKKILDINYKYGSMKQPMAKHILCRVTILFIYQKMGDRGGVIQIKRNINVRQKSCKVNEGVYFGELCNRLGHMVV